MILDHVGTLHAGTGAGVPLCGAPRNPFAAMYLWDDEAATCAKCRVMLELPPVVVLSERDSLTLLEALEVETAGERLRSAMKHRIRFTTADE